ncbi:MAG: translation initiation factor IF-3 [Armatimonadetes bacterium]|nr:translation initiation factor IF-3 [Armatimonadota bacterium]
METKRYRVNERIRAREVRVIDPDGKQLGIMSLQEALEAARSRQLDLIEVAPQATPPVCRIMDWGRFRYEQQKKQRESQKKSRQVEIKHIRVRPNTDEHDLEYKLRNARRFLLKGNKVKFNVIFRGPELRHREIGERQLQRFLEGLADIARPEQVPHMEGRQMIMVLEPKPEVLQRLQEERKRQRQEREPAPVVEADGDLISAGAAQATTPVAGVGSETVSQSVQGEVQQETE